MEGPTGGLLLDMCECVPQGWRRAKRAVVGVMLLASAKGGSGLKSVRLRLHFFDALSILSCCKPTKQPRSSLPLAACPLACLFVESKRINKNKENILKIKRLKKLLENRQDPRLQLQVDWLAL